MKEKLLVIAFVLLGIAVLGFAVVFFFRWVHMNVLDGSSSLYDRLWSRYTKHLIVGGVFLCLSIICFAISFLISKK